MIGYGAGIRRRLWQDALCATAIGLTCNCPAFATLGEDVASFATDQARTQASVRVLSKDKYLVHELTLASGATIREYAAEGGKVFAVAWSGGWRPNLRQLMGKHYAHYLDATQCKRRARGPGRIEHRGLVVVTGGHPRAFFGHAYLTDQLPPDIRIADIR